MYWKFNRKPARAFSLIEVIVVMCIVAILAGLFLITLSGGRTGDKIDRSVQQIYEDLLYIRSHAVSTNQDHRINFLSDTQWKLESLNSTTGNWEQTGEVRNMPGDVNLKSNTTGAGTLNNAAANLQSSPRGLYTFLNNSSGNPYITIVGMGTSKTKSIYVYVGGALEIKNP